METEERTKYRVFKANILDDDGNKVLAGEVVSLSPKLAKHYTKLGFLRPFFDEDEDEDAEPAEQGRDTVKPTRSRIRRGAPTEQL